MASFKNLPWKWAGLLFGMLLLLPSDGTPQNIHGYQTQSPPPPQKMQIPSGWTVFRGNSGLVVPHPAGWQIQERAAGSFLGYRPGQDGVAKAIVLVNPIERIEGRALAVVQGVGQIFPDIFPGVQVLKTRILSTAPEVAVAELQFAPQGQPFRGVALCFKHEQRGVLYAIGSAVGTWPQEETVMKQILSRFFYSDPSGQGRGASAPTMVPWRDPMEAAFTCPVPQGWKVDGGMKRFSAIDTRGEVLAISPDNRVRVRVGDSAIPPMVVPTQMMMSLGFHEGRWYAPDGVNNQLIMGYLPSTTFLTQFYLPQRVGRITNVQSRELPEISQQMIGPWRMAGMNVRMDTGEVTFATQTEGGPRNGYYFAQTVLVPFPPPTEGGGWYVIVLNGYLSDPKMEPMAQVVLNKMVAEHRKDPNWEAQQLRTTARVSQIQRQAQQETSNIINQTFQNRSRAQDRMHEKWTRTFRDQVLIEDPVTNQRFEVPSGGNYYWRLGAGQEFIGTETADRPYHPHTYIQEMRILP